MQFLRWHLIFFLIKKDLYFIKESGDTIEDGLINFDKLRKMAKGVRSIVQMTASSFVIQLIIKIN